MIPQSSTLLSVPLSVSAVDRREIPFQAARQRLASAWAQEAKEAWLTRNPDGITQEDLDAAGEVDPGNCSSSRGEQQ